ncbi:putative ion transporter [Paratrimastix pyriformis]|uniref:Ion transporter n=1 Tax=Paratrimastix pyriformis TaxID=342808 RepID=A0ABQ8UPC2_9EUKA|nr:putative ion transporter [Paratrimastix pyriformis]
MAGMSYGPGASMGGSVSGSTTGTMSTYYGNNGSLMGSSMGSSAAGSMASAEEYYEEMLAESDMTMSLTMGGTAGATSTGSTYSATHIERAKRRHVAKTLPMSKYYKSWSTFRRFLHGTVVEARWFSATTLVIVLLNTVMVTVQSIASIHAYALWSMAIVDAFFLAVYIFEAAAKIYVWRLNYFKDGWNVFDFVVVLASLTDYLQYLSITGVGVDVKIFRFLRIFRAVRAVRTLRVLRTVRMLRNLQMIVNTILSSASALGSIAALLFLIMYVFALIGRSLFAATLPERFGTLWYSFFTLFQMLTLDDWYTVQEENRPSDPTLLLFLIVFIIVETFIFINLFIAVICNNLEQANIRAIAQKRAVIHSFKRQKEKAQALELAKMDRSIASTADLSRTNMSQPVPSPLASPPTVEGGPEGGPPVITPQLVPPQTPGGTVITMGLGGANGPIASAHEVVDDIMHGAEAADGVLLLAALESNLENYQAKAKLLDDLVDIAEDSANRGR